MYNTRREGEVSMNICKDVYMYKSRRKGEASMYICKGVSKNK